MSKKETISERLNRLLNYWDNVLADAKIIDNEPEPVNKTTSSEISSIYGLSPSQAKAWLKKEPNYTADDILQREEDRRGLDRTALGALYKGRGVSAEQQTTSTVWVN